jgi:peptidoglycan hydrolase-like protein with peptidoglycan-binding domain
MLQGRVRLQLVAFLLLSGGVAGNLFLLQPHTRAPGAARIAEPHGEINVATLEPVGTAEPIRFGDTGSIARDSSAASPDIPTASADVTRAVQRELRIRGYETGAADGVEGLVTRAAVMAFEYDHGLPLTGRPTQQLLKYILLGSSGANAKRHPTRAKTAEAAEVIRSVQSSLARLGYSPGPANGRLTGATARAIHEFEVDQALPESGRVSGPLVSRLQRLAGEGRIASDG